MTERRRPHWTIASARQNFPALVSLAAREPQDIYRRDTLVARVVSPVAAPASRPSPAELLAEIQRVCAEDNYTLDVPPRTDRPNPFTRAPKGSSKKQRGRRP